MTSSWRPLNVPILGLNTKRDPKLGPVGRLLKCDNAWMDRDGEIRQRNGFKLLPTRIVDTGASFVDTRTAPQDCTSIASWDNSLIAAFRAYPALSASRSLYEYSPTLASWVTKKMSLGGCSPALSREDVERVLEVGAPEAFLANNGVIDEGDLAVIGDVACVAYKATLNGASIISVKIYDLVTGAVIRDDKQLIAGSRPRVVAVPGDITNSYFAVFYSTGANLDQVGATTYIVTSGSQAQVHSQYTNLISATGTNGRSNYDAVLMPNTALTIAVAWVNWDGVAASYFPKWRSFNATTGALGSAVTGTTAAGTTAVGDDARVAWAATDSTSALHLYQRGSTSSLYRTQINATTLAQVSANFIASGGFGDSHNYGHAAFFDETKGVSYLASRDPVGAIVVHADSTAHITAASGFIQSRMYGFRESSSAPVHPYFIVNSGGADPTAFLCRFNPNTNATVPVARLDTGSNGFAFANGHQWPTSLAVHSTGIYALVPIVTEKAATGSVYNSRVSLHLVQISSRNDYLSNIAPMANSLMLAGGIPYGWDRDDTYPIGLHPAASPLSLTGSATAGGLTASGVYKYRFVVAYSMGGRIYRSPPSLPASVTLTSGQTSVVMTLPAQLTGLPARSIRVEVYRTVNGGDTYYRVKDLATELWGAASYHDLSTTDTQLASHELLYTTGNVLDNYPAPAAKSLAAWGNRLFALSSEFPTRIYFSKTVVDGLGVGFNPALYIEAADAFGEFTAIAATDRALIAFKKDAIYAISGDGPDNTGSGGQFSLQQISTGYGCTNDASIVAMPAGLMFLGDNGINLLDRGFAASLAGANVVEYTDVTPIVGACMLPARSMACWVASNGHAYVWDWENGQWYRWITPAASCVGCCEYQGALVVADSSGLVFQEVAGQTWDELTTLLARTAISMDVTFAPIATAGIAGFERLREIQLVGQRDSDCTVTTTVRYDYLPTDVQALAADVSAASGLDRLIRVKTNRQKASAFEINVKTTFEGRTPAYGQGYRLSALALEVAVKSGLNRRHGSAV